MTTLVIVESPGKVEKIRSFLGPGFTVLASYGHVRDLPPHGDIGVDIQGETVTPHYDILDRAQRAVGAITAAARLAIAVILATDADREGEAIAWHISEVIGRHRSYQRATFTEITKAAVLHAVSFPRAIDMHLVDAQQTRRLLDRIVGWVVSATLKQGCGNPAAASAGRVQTPAVRLVVERERAIAAFRPTTYFVIDAGLIGRESQQGDERRFRARLVRWQGAEVGQTITIRADADAIVTTCRGHAHWWVHQITAVPRQRHAPPPFVTATLQQAASVALRWKPAATMAVAQRLYEAGHITYMRTDSVQMSADACALMRAVIREKFGSEYVPQEPIAHQRVVAGAQDAHECIRVTDPTREPASLAGEDGMLYQLIHVRSLACQMTPGRDLTTSITIASGDAIVAQPTTIFLARGTIMEVDGWRRALAQLPEEIEDPPKDLGDPTDGHSSLPSLAQGDAVRLGLLAPAQRTTSAPSRFTEASLIKALERHGIGRPSTYATILSTIQDRGYVADQRGKLVGTELGMVVIDYLVAHFGDHVADIAFTARIEAELDGIAAGSTAWQPAVAAFTRALRTRAQAAGLQRDPLVRQAAAGTNSPSAPRSSPRARPSSSARPRRRTIAPAPSCPACGAMTVRRTSARGPFFGCSTYPMCTGIVPLKR